MTKLFPLLLILTTLFSCSSRQDDSKFLVKTIKTDSEGMLFGGKAVKGLSIAVKKSDLAPHKVKVSLKNEGSRNMVLYSSFRVYTGQIGSASDIFLRVYDNETKLELDLKNFSTDGGGDNSNPNGFVTLKPGDYVERILDLSEFFNLKNNHKYTVIAEYDHLESGYENRSGNWVEMNAWTGRCASNKLIILTK